MLHIGLTGGLASGKSFVGRILQELGCCLIRFDDLGHQVLEPGGEAYAEVLQEFAPAIPQLVQANGEIDRRALGAYAFADPERLTRLNALIHPAVRRMEKRLAAAYFALHPHGIVVAEAAILVETGSYREYDRLIVAVCRPEQQLERAMARDGLTQPEVEQRLARQMPLADKVRFADYVIDTSGSKEHTAEQVRALYAQLSNLDGPTSVEKKTPCD